VVLATAPPAQAESNDNRMVGQIDVFQLRPNNEFLIGYDGVTGKLVPELATEWKLNPDGKSFTFTLRKGVQFHRNMGEFTAKDAKFSWENLTQADSLQVEAPTWKRVVKSIDIVNDYQVVYNLDPDANFIHGISRAEGGMEIRSKASWDKLGHDPTMQDPMLAGTAPYQYKERKQAEFIRFERFDNHWGKIRPDFPEFEFRWIREPSTRLAGLLTGEIHIAPLPNDLLIQAEKQGMKLVQGKVAGPRILFRPYGLDVKDQNNLDAGWMFPESPLTDLRVRKALQKAINIDEINKSIFAGKGQAMFHTVLHPSRPGWDPRFEKDFKDEYGYDVEAAKKLLADAGYGPGKQLETNVHLVELAQFPGTADVSEAIANYWRAIGVKVNLVTMDTAQRSTLARQKKFSNDWIIDGTSSDVHIFLQTRWGPSQGGGGGAVPDGGRDPEVTRQFLALRSMLDEKKLDEAYRQLGIRGWQQHISLNLLWLPAEAAVNPKIVSDYQFPGSISGTWTHVEFVKAAR